MCRSYRKLDRKRKYNYLKKIFTAIYLYTVKNNVLHINTGKIEITQAYNKLPRDMLKI